jgi:hypothetical protein
LSLAFPLFFFPFSRYDHVCGKRYPVHQYALTNLYRVAEGVSSKVNARLF